jgi:hypothetical protein
VYAAISASVSASTTSSRDAPTSSPMFRSGCAATSRLNTRSASVGSVMAWLRPQGWVTFSQCREPASRAALAATRSAALRCRSVSVHIGTLLRGFTAITA